jgi:hypothetical protein
MMPIRVLLAKRNFPPDEIEKLTSAFDQALRSLNIADRKDDPIGEIVARKIIEVRALAMQRRSPTWLATKTCIESARAPPTILGGGCGARQLRLWL